MTAPPVTATNPIACTLDGAAYADRTAWIATLNRSALRSHRRDGLVLVLDYAPDAAASVRELVERERRCCAFLGFQVEDSAHGVRLRIEAPKDARDALDAIFAPFLMGAP